MNLEVYSDDIDSDEEFENNVNDGDIERNIKCGKFFAIATGKRWMENLNTVKEMSSAEDTSVNDYPCSTEERNVRDNKNGIDRCSSTQDCQKLTSDYTVISSGYYSEESQEIPLVSPDVQSINDYTFSGDGVPSSTEHTLSSSESTKTIIERKLPHSTSLETKAETSKPRTELPNFDELGVGYYESIDIEEPPDPEDAILVIPKPKGATPTQVRPILQIPKNIGSFPACRNMDQKTHTISTWSLPERFHRILSPPVKECLPPFPDYLREHDLTFRSLTVLHKQYLSENIQLMIKNGESYEDILKMMNKADECLDSLVSLSFESGDEKPEQKTTCTLLSHAEPVGMPMQASPDSGPPSATINVLDYLCIALQCNDDYCKERVCRQGRLWLSTLEHGLREIAERGNVQDNPSVWLIEILIEHARNCEEDMNCQVPLCKAIFPIIDEDTSTAEMIVKLTKEYGKNNIEFTGFHETVDTISHFSQDGHNFDHENLSYKIIKKLGLSNVAIASVTNPPGAHVVIKRISEDAIECLEKFAYDGQHSDFLVKHHWMKQTPRGIFLCSDFAGGSLDEKNKHSKLDSVTAKDILIKMASAANYLHRKGLLILDWSSTNIVMGDDGRTPQLCNVQRATLIEPNQILDEEEIEMIRMKLPAVMLPPEANQGRLRIPHSDSWGLGLLYYEMVTGKPAFYHLRHKLPFEIRSEILLHHGLGLESVEIIDSHDKQIVNYLCQDFPEDRLTTIDVSKGQF